MEEPGSRRIEMGRSLSNDGGQFVRGDGHGGCKPGNPFQGKYQFVWGGGLVAHSLDHDVARNLDRDKKVPFSQLKTHRGRTGVGFESCADDLGLAAVFALEMEGRCGLGDDALEIGDFFHVQIVVHGGELVMRPLDGGFDIFLVDVRFTEGAVR